MGDPDLVLFLKLYKMHYYNLQLIQEDLRSS